jgi:hypothetical protein
MLGQAGDILLTYCRVWILPHMSLSRANPQEHPIRGPFAGPQFQVDGFHVEVKAFN